MDAVTSHDVKCRFYLGQQTNMAPKCCLRASVRKAMPFCLQKRQFIIFRKGDNILIDLKICPICYLPIIKLRVTVKINSLFTI